jgi:hypothetical protein
MRIGPHRAVLAQGGVPANQHEGERRHGEPVEKAEDVWSAYERPELRDVEAVDRERRDIEHDHRPEIRDPDRAVPRRAFFGDEIVRTGS